MAALFIIVSLMTNRAKQRVMLVFEGIDTISTVSLNGAAVGRTDNMFLQYVRWVNSHDPHEAVHSQH